MEYNYSEHQRWLEDDGDNTHRLKYYLTNESIVVDVGGYHGNWSEKILKLYDSRIFILEPLNSYYQINIEKFGQVSNVSVLNYGLSSTEGEVLINLDNDSSSIYKKGKRVEKIKVKPIDSFMKEYNIQHIDLLKLNIEGSEYDVLEDIIEKKLHHVIENIQIQFHVFIEGCQERRIKIQEILSETHRCTYNYEFIWENWTLKK
jgi:FkbM family methyltransferase